MQKNSQQIPFPQEEFVFLKQLLEGVHVVRISVHLTSVQTRYPHRLNSYPGELEAKQGGCRDICAGEKISVKAKGTAMRVQVRVNGRGGGERYECECDA